MNALERAVGSLARVLDEQRVPYMVIGGIANLVWGQPRSTLDVDASVMVEEKAWPELIAQLDQVFRVIPRDPVGFLRETHVLPVETADGVRVDLVWAQLSYEHKAIARATLEDIAGQRVRVCRPEDLVIHKIIAERPKDQQDVQGIIQRQSPRLDRRYLTQTVQAMSKVLEKPELVTFLKRCLQESHPHRKRVSVRRRRP